MDAVSQWFLSGYPEQALFPGVWRCQFRMCHHRDDGLVVMTVGDQRDGGRRLLPMFQDYPFMSVVGWPRVGGEPEIVERSAHLTADEAATAHEYLKNLFSETEA